MKSDFSRVMGAPPSLFCYVHTILARLDIGANAYCHLIGRDDENILSSCTDQSDGSLDISAHNNFGPCQFRPITKSAYTISAHKCNNVSLVCLSIIGIIRSAYL